MMRLNGTSYYIDCVAARLPRSSDAEVSFRHYGSINEKLLYEPAMTHHHSILMLLMPKSRSTQAKAILESNKVDENEPKVSFAKGKDR